MAKLCRRGRPVVQQIRLGKHERRTVDRLVQRAKRFKLTRYVAAKRETSIAVKIRKHLNTPLLSGQLQVERTPDKTTLFGRKFYPDAWVPGAKIRPLLALEFKKLTEKRHKGSFKESLSQALVYATRYKAVLVVLFDLTEGHRFKNKLGRGNRAESRFARALAEDQRIHIVVLAAS